MGESEDFRARIADPELLALYERWRSLFHGGKLPSRSDIDPLTIPAKVLPYVVLADVVDGGRRIRYRLVGTNMVSEWGQDFTGCYLDEIMEGSYRAFLENLFADVVSRRCAVLSESAFRWDVGRATHTRRLFMPLASDGETVDGVLIGQIFKRDAGGLTPRKIVEDLPGHVETFRMHDEA